MSNLTISEVSCAVICGREFVCGLPDCKAKSRKRYVKAITAAERLLTKLRKSQDPHFCDLPNHKSGNGVICTRGQAKFTFLQATYNRTMRGTKSTFGTWIHPQLFGSATIDTVSFEIQRIVTGGCMFGDSLVAVGANGTVPACAKSVEEYFSPENPILKVQQLSTEHPNEVKDLAQLKLLLPLLQDITEPAIIYYNVPVPEYILQGLQWYSEGWMTTKALAQYITLVVGRGRVQKAKVRSLLSQVKMESSSHFQIGQSWSALDPLRLHELDGLPYDDLATKVSGMSLSAACDRLAGESEAWREYFCSVLAEEEEEEKKRKRTLHDSGHS